MNREQIIRKVFLSYYDKTLTRVLSEPKDYTKTPLKHILWYLLYRYGKLSYTYIAKSYGNLNRTWVTEASRKVERTFEVPLKQDLEFIEQRIKQELLQLPIENNLKEINSLYVEIDLFIDEVLRYQGTHSVINKSWRHWKNNRALELKSQLCQYENRDNPNIACFRLTSQDGEKTITIQKQRKHGKKAVSM